MSKKESQTRGTYNMLKVGDKVRVRKDLKKKWVIIYKVLMLQMLCFVKLTSCNYFIEYLTKKLMMIGAMKLKNYPL